MAATVVRAVKAAETEVAAPEVEVAKRAVAVGMVVMRAVVRAVAGTAVEARE